MTYQRANTSGKEWFEEWFDSPYYHILYQHRNETEAQFFIDNLCSFLQIKPRETILDLACGKGRHSVYLNKKGYEVTGVDLSVENIAFARQFANDRLHFARHDMREVFRPAAFQYIFNLFTSFGYFQTRNEDLQAIRAAASGLKPGGTLVIDFFNTGQVMNAIRQVPSTTVVAGGIAFSIHKSLVADRVVKTISFVDKGHHYVFREEVRALQQADFLHYFEQAGLQPEAIFGGYDLGPYQPDRSERMIFVARKP
jgi:SAM-dependent methyltransferase